ncbi:SLAM family member 5 isoform X2 [Maylandia zebra]|uniref:SLAM family member 5-like n=1 Tax=Astatotilapia calliptera TaxID=8154 RepID=UPI000329D65A|nr:SLAM family member 5 isoform X1 [Maylandia zebra]XP_026004229.1 SLAM family member 5-like [Astatotilapia calliptera]
MRCILFWGAILWMYSSETKGLQHVFVLHGKDLHLDVEKPVKLEKKTDFFWKFNTSNYVGKISYNKESVLFGSYEVRADFFGQNYSLVLKNVKHSDSGDYTAVVTGGKEQRVGEIKVIVQDPVSPVNLTLTSSSSDSCNLTVTCTIVDLNISRTFRCDAHNCSLLEENPSTTDMLSSLIVYLQQDTVFCNHSNEVSWKNSMMVLKSQCDTKSGHIDANNTTVTVCVVVAAIIIILVIGYIHHRTKHKNTRETIENTVYAVPEVIRTTPPMEQSPISDTSPTSTYSFVRPHSGPNRSTEARSKALPESLYAQVEIHPRS